LNPKDVAAQTRILFDASPWAIVGMTIVGMTATSKRDKA
jgi:F0F1-type ATP synthase assembly protein I